MDPDDVRAITNYLMMGKYPSGLNRDDKRSLRQKATSFMLSEDGRLYHKGKEGKRQLVICNPDEKLQIIHAMHTEPGSRGGHNGMNTTIRKISEQYWWRRLVEDVRAFCKNCGVCSHLTVTNHRSNAYAMSADWQTDLNSFIEPVCVSAPVTEYTDLNSSSYASDLLSMLSSLYEQKVCCDIILSAGRFQTQAHKVVLIASSGFFKSLLLDKDLPFNDVITLSNISGPCLEAMVAYLYSGTLRLNKENAQQMLEASVSLDVASAVDLCQTFLNQANQYNENQPKVEAPAPMPVVTLVEEKLAIKHDDESAELEMFIESYLAENRNSSELTSVKQEDHGVTERRTRGKKEIQSSKLRKSEQPKTGDTYLPPESRKRKKSEDCLTAAAQNDCPQKRSRRQICKASEVSEVAPERRYATRSSTGAMTLKTKEEIKAVSQASLNLQMNSEEKSKAVESVQQNEKASDCANYIGLHRKFLLESGDRFVCDTCKTGFKLWTGLRIHCRLAHGLTHGLTVTQEMVYWLSRLAVDYAQRVGLNSRCKIVTREDSPEETKYCCTTYDANFGLKIEVLAHKRQKQDIFHSFGASRSFKQILKRLKFLHRPTPVQNDPGTSIPVNGSSILPPANGLVASAAYVGEDTFSISNKCGWCGQTFSSRSQLVDHRQTVHRKPKIQENHVKKRRVQRDWNCKEKGCSQQFKTKDKLKVHMSELHPSVVFSCPDCRFKTQVEQILLRHLVRRHHERHMCQLCGKAYHKPFLLRVHLFNRHKLSDPQLKLYHCQHEGCDYACPSKNGLNLHVLKHTAGNPFPCQLCSKTFKRAVGLEKHINKIHLGIRPYICDKCGVSYGDESELKIHMTRHAENKPYSCSYCTYSTFQKGSLKSHLFNRHQVLMDQEMPVMKCDMCSFTTDKKCRFHDHVKMHQNIRDIPCAECGKMFVTKKTLRQHIIKVHRQKQLSCSFCPYTTSAQSKLQEHVRILHGQQDMQKTFVESTQQQPSPAQIQLHQQSINGIISAAAVTMHAMAQEYQSLMPLDTPQQQQQLGGLVTDSSIVVGIPMSLDGGAYCFQALDRSHLVL